MFLGDRCLHFSGSATYKDWILINFLGNVTTGRASSTVIVKNHLMMIMYISMLWYLHSKRGSVWPHELAALPDVIIAKCRSARILLKCVLQNLPDICYIDCSHPAVSVIAASEPASYSTARLRESMNALNGSCICHQHVLCNLNSCVTPWGLYCFVHKQPLCQLVI